MYNCIVKCPWTSGQDCGMRQTIQQLFHAMSCASLFVLVHNDEIDWNDLLYYTGNPWVMRIIINFPKERFLFKEAFIFAIYFG